MQDFAKPMKVHHSRFRYSSLLVAATDLTTLPLWLIATSGLHGVRRAVAPSWEVCGRHEREAVARHQTRPSPSQLRDFSDRSNAATSPVGLPLPPHQLRQCRWAPVCEECDRGVTGSSHSNHRATRRARLVPDRASHRCAGKQSLFSVVAFALEGCWHRCRAPHHVCVTAAFGNQAAQEVCASPLRHCQRDQRLGPSASCGVFLVVTVRAAQWL